MQGKILQVILPAEFGDIRNNNVDMLYNFTLHGCKIDMAVASDRQNDTLAVYRIAPVSRMLVDVGTADMIETIFGIDDVSKQPTASAPILIRQTARPMFS